MINEYIVARPPILRDHAQLQNSPLMRARFNNGNDLKKLAYINKFMLHELHNAKCLTRQEQTGNLAAVGRVILEIR